MPLPLQEYRERSVNSLQSHFVDFLLYLAMVDLKVEAKTEAKQALEEYLAPNPRLPLIASLYPHTGHTDSLFIYKAFEQLMPEQVNVLRFVSAKDTWSNPFKRAFARMVIGTPYLFDRDNPSAFLPQVREMKKILKPEDETPAQSLAVYPQGTRTPNAPIRELPPMLASQAKVPLVIFNIHDAETVFPKVTDEEQASQFIQILTERLRTRRGRKHHVTVSMTDVIPAEVKRDERSERFFDAHLNG